MANAQEKKILVVDDEPDVRNFLAACIEDAGFQVDTAVDGVDALEKIETNPPVPSFGTRLRYPRYRCGQKYPPFRHRPRRWRVPAGMQRACLKRISAR